MLCGADGHTKAACARPGGGEYKAAKGGKGGQKGHAADTERSDGAVNTGAANSAQAVTDASNVPWRRARLRAAGEALRHPLRREESSYS